MRHTAIIFVFFNLVLFAFAQIGGGISLPIQLAISVLLIGIVGIPHGAIDHVLFIQTTKGNPFIFYTFYFGLIGLSIAIWVFVPTAGFLFFLVLSAYHFGQSQFSKYHLLTRYVKWVLYLSWGCSILAALMVYNQQEIIVFSELSVDLKQLQVVFQLSIQKTILVFSTFIFLLVFILHRKTFSKSEFLLEIMFFALIHLSFYMHSLLIGFSIYFAAIHSLSVLKQEYAFLKSKFSNFNLRSFLRILTPYTLISIGGLSVLIGLSHSGIIEVSKTMVVFISIAALTLPHSVVMEKFYQRVN